MVSDPIPPRPHSPTTAKACALGRARDCFRNHRRIRSQRNIRDPELAIYAKGLGIDEAVQQILLKLEREGCLR